MLLPFTIPSTTYNTRLPPVNLNNILVNASCFDFIAASQINAIVIVIAILTVRFENKYRSKRLQENVMYCMLGVIAY